MSTRVRFGIAPAGQPRRYFLLFCRAGPSAALLSCGSSATDAPVRALVTCSQQEEDRYDASTSAVGGDGAGDAVRHRIVRESLVGQLPLGAHEQSVHIEGRRQRVERVDQLTHRRDQRLEPIQWEDTRAGGWRHAAQELPRDGWAPRGGGGG